MITRKDCARRTNPDKKRSCIHLHLQEWGRSAVKPLDLWSSVPQKVGSRLRFGKSISVLAVVFATGAVSCDRKSDAPDVAVQPADTDEAEAEAHPVMAPADQGILVRSRTRTPDLNDEPQACAEGMVLVEGNYCPRVQQTCKKFLDPKGRYEHFRCAEYAQPKCLSKKREHKRYCIDRDEYTEPGETLPANHRSFTHAERTCKALGKRVCTESEWNFACEGEEMLPYPYGMKRDPSACNADRTDIVSPAGELRDLRAPSGAFPRCESPFGVRDLSGNLEEFVRIDGPGPARPAMKGAYWQPSRNFCRAAQTAHDRYYNGTETGFRCCSDPEDTP